MVEREEKTVLGSPYKPVEVLKINVFFKYRPQPTSVPIVFNYSLSYEKTLGTSCPTGPILKILIITVCYLGIG